MLASAEFYLPGSKIPKVFLDCDKQINEQYPEPEIVTEPIEVPMPFIEGCKGAKGPIVVTKDWYVKTKKKQLARIASNMKDARIEMMQLLADKDRLRYKLGQLNGANKKDAKKIVAINVKLRDIDAELEVLQEMSGVNLEKLDKGTKLGRFVGRLKRVFHRVKKKVINWYEQYEEIVKAVAVSVIPAIISAVVKGIIKLFS